MKVELKKLRLGISAVTNDILVGIPAPDGSEMLHEKIVNNDFYKAIIDLLTLRGDISITEMETGNEWVLSLKKIEQ